MIKIFESFFLGLILLTSVTAKSQTGSLLKEVMHHSPNVSTLGKFGEVPVGYYTGVPHISIPIYEVTSGHLKLPISLDYHAGGVKVEELASNVGLSWALQAGGSISRSVRGAQDAESGWLSGQVQTLIENYGNGQGGAQPSSEVLFGLESQVEDGESDVYHFNFGGRSGKFMIDQLGQVQLIPKADIQASRILGGWELVDEMGTRYRFQKSEWHWSPNGGIDYQTSWFLTEIISSDGKHKITLYYDDWSMSYEIMAGETKYYSTNATYGLCRSNTGPIMNTTSISTQRLKRIDFENGYIKFDYNVDRCDLIGDQTLSEIIVYTLNDDLIKKYQLSQSYFGENLGCNAGSAHLKRLKLTSVTEVSSTDAKPPYVFSYEEGINMPSRFSLSQDHWGYYNGAGNATLVAGATPDFIAPWSQPTLWLGADRSTNPATAQVGILKSIKYPTGGITNFTYESNMVNNDRITPRYETVPRTLIYTQSPGMIFSDLQIPLNPGSLVIPSSGALVDYFVVEGLDGTPWVNCDITQVWLTKNGENFMEMGNIKVGSIGNTDYSELGFFLEEGTYGLKIYSDCYAESPVPNFSITLRARVPVLLESPDLQYVGGLRVKQVEDLPDDGGLPVSREYKYTQESDASRSSGVVYNLPLYEKPFTIYKFSSYGGSNCAFNLCSYVVKAATSSYPLATSSASYVGYMFVREILSNSSENHYSYLTNSLGGIPLFPYVPHEGFDWHRGFLLNQKSYSVEAGQLRLIKETTNTFIESSETIINGLRVDRTEVRDVDDFCRQLNPLAYPPLPPNIYAYYMAITRFFATGSTIEKVYTYTQPGNLVSIIEKKTDFTYDPIHFQLIEEKETLLTEAGNIEEKVAYRKYPTAYGFPPESLGYPPPTDPDAKAIKNLLDLHMVSTPIEEYVVKRTINAQGQISNQRVASGLLNTFKPDTPYPDQVYRLKLDQPISLASFASSGVPNSIFQKSSLYEPVAKFLDYDAKGNLLAQQKTDDAVISYLWGYDKTYPIAEIKNAINASSNTLFPFTNSATVEITEYISETPILPSFQLSTSQTISGVANLFGNGNSLPPSPLTILLLKRSDGTPVFEINAVWGQNYYNNFLLSPGTYQWYFSVGDISFSPPALTSIQLSMSNSYSTEKTGSRIFHTSFEEDGNYTAYSYSGDKAWLGSYTIYLPSQNGNYKLTYTKWNGTSWQYMAQDISVSSGAVQALVIGDASSIIDEVRLYPADAQMTTYTYRPLIGMTSSTDSNCVLTRFEYDSFGRLKLAKDYEGNILKTYTYHYKGQ